VGLHHGHHAFALDKSASDGSRPLTAIELDLTIRCWSLQVSPRDMQDIETLPRASVELATMPGEALAPPQPLVWNRNWTVAVVVSCLLHAGVAAAFLISPAGTFDTRDADQAEGSDRSGEKVVGSALENDGTINVALVPDPKPAKPKPDKPNPEQPSRSARQAAPPVQPAKQPLQQRAPAPKVLVASSPGPDAPPAEPPEQPVTSADSSEATASVPDRPPIPVPRPPAAPASAETPYEQRGAASGLEARRAAASKGKKKAGSGDLAASRYSGEVAAKLARANRHVSEAAQTTARNNAIVAFIVLADGKIADLQLQESSGSEALDQFALDLVRKQAPFPPIPPETGISSWRFKTPIGPF
jgi:protein TonB